MFVHDLLREKCVVDHDVSALINIVSEHGCRLVGIDGATGSGKSHLAGELKRQLQWPHCDLDSYLARDGRPFLEQLNYERLKIDLAEGPPMIVSGVCLLAVLARINLTCDFLIYVARVTEQGLPGDLDMIDADFSTEDVPDHFGDLDRDIYFYHREYRPVTNSTLVYLRLPQKTAASDLGEA